MPPPHTDSQFWEGRSHNPGFEQGRIYWETIVFGSETFASGLRHCPTWNLMLWACQGALCLGLCCAWTGMSGQRGAGGLRGQGLQPWLFWELWKVQVAW